MQKKSLYSFIAILLAGLIVLAMQTNETPPAKGKKPSFTLPDTKDQKVAVSNFRGKVVMVNVWATWCPPCVHEIPDLVKLRNDYKDKGFEILGLVHPMRLHKNQVLKMVKNFKMDYPVLWATNEAIAELGNVEALPHTFILDKEGNIVEDINLAGDYKTFEKYIKKYLK